MRANNLLAARGWERLAEQPEGRPASNGGQQHGLFG
jgi:hypothetical protein